MNHYQQKFSFFPNHSRSTASTRKYPLLPSLPLSLHSSLPLPLSSFLPFLIWPGWWFLLEVFSLRPATTQIPQTSPPQTVVPEPSFSRGLPGPSFPATGFPSTTERGRSHLVAMATPTSERLEVLGEIGEGGGGNSSQSSCSTASSATSQLVLSPLTALPGRKRKSFTD